MKNITEKIDGYLNEERSESASFLDDAFIQIDYLKNASDQMKIMLKNEEERKTIKTLKNMEKTLSELKKIIQNLKKEWNE